MSKITRADIIAYGKTLLDDLVEKYNAGQYVEAQEAAAKVELNLDCLNVIDSEHSDNPVWMNPKSLFETALIKLNSEGNIHQIAASNNGSKEILHTLNTDYVPPIDK